MTDAGEILKRIRARGANVMIDAGKLRIINRDKLPAGAGDFIRKNAKAIAEFLEREHEFEERAAIIQYDGGLRRSDAESLASVLLASVPSECDPADWTWFVSKAAEIVDARCAA